MYKEYEMHGNFTIKNFVIKYMCISSLILILSVVRFIKKLTQFFIIKALHLLNYIKLKIIKNYLPFKFLRKFAFNKCAKLYSFRTNYINLRLKLM